jgi:signal transduction histidine kinase
MGQAGRHTEDVLLVIVWLSRAAMLIVVGAEALPQGQPDEQAPTLQVGVFVLVCVLTGFWALLDFRPATVPRPDRWLVVILAVITVSSGFASTPVHAGILVVPAATAAMAASSDFSELVSSTVAGLAIFSILIGSMVFDSGPGTMLGFSLGIVGAYTFGRNRRVYRVQAEQAATMLKQAEQLQVQQRRADVLDERSRIAREIHDVLAHSLGGLSIQIQAARAMLTDHHDMDRALEVLTTAQRMATDGLVETRRAVHALRNDTLPLERELAALAETHRGRYRTAVVVTVDSDPRQLSPATTVALLRVAQEALINAAKHAPHQRIDLSLDYPADKVRLIVTNTLGENHQAEAAADPDLSTVDGGYGLTGMRERLLLLGGTLAAGRHGAVWTVVAQSPHYQLPQAVV